MIIVSTTLVSNHDSLIVEALRSVVDWVDVCLIVDTGSTDNTLARAREVAGPKYVGCQCPWTGAADVRNFALAAALEIGGQWTVTLDADERIVVDPSFDVRAELESATEGVLYVPASDASYVKERFFRLPSGAAWEGPTHEAFPAHRVGCRTLDGITFDEVAKSNDEAIRRFACDVDLLSAYSQLHPDEPRWLFYLGESHLNLNQLEPAIIAYDRCAALRGWSEESAWACFQCAKCLVGLDRLEEALERLALGLSRHAGLAELAWFAGVLCYRLGRDHQAIYWSWLAVTHGLFRGKGRDVPRIGFRDPTGLWEGPFDTIHWAERRLGNLAAASEAKATWQQAREDRARATR